MSIKRTIITTIVALTLVAVVAPAVAQGVTIDELLAQIATLQAQLLALQGGATPVPTGNVACAGVTFTRALVVGSTGSDVKCLQVLLNTNGYTLAATGAGSPGMETSYFGPITLAAVRAFQTAKGWTPANQVGPLTRAALNALVVSTPATPATPGVTPGTGTEGSLTVTKSVSPVSGVEMNTGATNVGVLAADVKATGSNVTVNRVDVLFDTAISGTSCNIRPWTNISGITVSDGSTSKTIDVTSSSVTETTVGSSYTIRVEGLNILVPKDTTKKLTVSVNAVSALPSGATSCVNGIEFAANAIRGTDTLGVSQYGPSSALTSVNSFTVKSGDTGTLTVSAHSDNPKAKNIIVSETASTENVVLLKFNVEAKSNDVILRKVYVQPYSSSTTLATTMPTMKLLDGTTEVASTSTAASATFDVTAITIPKGTTKTFTVVGTIAKTNASAVSEGDYVYANMDAADVTGEDATTFAAVTGTGSNLTGTYQYAYLKAPVFAYVTSSIVGVAGTSGSTTQSANTELKFNVTANGGDIYIANYDSTAASSGIVSTSTALGSSGTVAYTFDTAATAGTYAWKVANGETKTFTVTATITNEDSYSAGFFGGTGVLNVKWYTSDEDNTDLYTTQTWGLEDLKTGQFFLYPRL